MKGNEWASQSSDLPCKKLSSLPRAILPILSQLTSCLLQSEKYLQFLCVAHFSNKMLIFWYTSWLIFFRASILCNSAVDVNELEIQNFIWMPSVFGDRQCIQHACKATVMCRPYTSARIHIYGAHTSLWLQGMEIWRWWAEARGISCQLFQHSADML